MSGSGPKIGDIFALLLVSRHREKAGQIEEIAIGLIDSKYESFLFYEPFANFLSGHGDVAVVSPTPPTALPPAPTVSLKKRVTRFIAPEAPKPENGEETGTG